MANYREVDWLLGRRFVTDFRVVEVAARRPGQTEDDRTVMLHLQGDAAVISLGELRALVESGIVQEAAERPGG